jgi:hypothetical protein
MIYILFYIICCIFIIIGIHFLWEYIKNYITIPKKKNIANWEIEKYKNMIAEITYNKIAEKEEDNKIVIHSLLEPNISEEEIQKDLQQYMNEIGII